MAGRALRLLLVALALALAPAPAAAQALAQLIADSLRIEADRTLVAEGNVEVFYQGNRLRAARVTYTRGPTRAEDRLEIAGPIVLDDGARVLILADAAELSGDLQDGLMTGARMVLDRQLQLAADTIAREGGRITRLSRAVASSCQVCAERPVPLWEIRAATIEHDAEARRLRFERAEFRVMGQPLLVIPRLTMPDPTVRRATGFLPPELVTSSRLGAGVQLPYFIALAPDRDLTLTPRIATGPNLRLGLRYRQAFAAGTLELSGALVRDQLGAGSLRGHAAARGDFALAPTTRLSFDIEVAGDRRYPADHGLGAGDLLVSDVRIDRITRDSLGLARATYFESLRPGVDNARLPNLVGELRHETRFAMPGIGGAARLSLDTLVLARRSELSAGGAGRDMARAALRLDWRRDWLLPGGVQAAALADVQADHFRIRQDATHPGRITRLSPAAALELRWPLMRVEGSGAHQLLEPVAQLVLAPRRLRAAPNEDSRLPEFDEASLFALHRFSGADAREAGSRAHLGLSWTRIAPEGWSATLAAGRVLRADPAPFSRLSGLGGRQSDWLAAARLETTGGLALQARALIDSEGRSARQEWRLAYAAPRMALATTVVQLSADPAEDRPDPTTEFGIDGTLRLSDNWEAQADWRHDLERGQPWRAGIGARFRNECLAVDVSLSRRFTSSTRVAAQTEFGLRVDLIGFGDRPGGPARPCAR